MLRRDFVFILVALLLVLPAMALAETNRQATTLSGEWTAYFTGANWWQICRISIDVDGKVKDGICIDSGAQQWTAAGSLTVKEDWWAEGNISETGPGDSRNSLTIVQVSIREKIMLGVGHDGPGQKFSFMAMKQ